MEFGEQKTSGVRKGAITMKKNRYAGYGKVMPGDEMYNFAMDRFNDLLREAEASRLYAPAPGSDSGKKSRSTLQVFRHLFAQLF
jgi:hypothetical protein